MITRSTQKHKPAKTVRVKRPFYEQIVAENAALKEQVEHHEHNKALLQQIVAYLRTVELGHTERQAELEVRITELEDDIRA